MRSNYRRTPESRMLYVTVSRVLQGRAAAATPFIVFVRLWPPPSLSAGVGSLSYQLVAACLSLRSEALSLTLFFVWDRLKPQIVLRPSSSLFQRCLGIPAPCVNTNCKSAAFVSKSASRGAHHLFVRIGDFYRGCGVRILPVPLIENIS